MTVKNMINRSLDTDSMSQNNRHVYPIFGLVVGVVNCNSGNVVDFKMH